MHESKEKALDLVNKISLEMEQLPYSYCKALAILMVKEIENAFDCYNPDSDDYVNRDKYYMYWHKVRNKIKKL